MTFQTDNGDPRDDQTLIRQYKSTGDLQHLGVLYGRYMHLVYGVCLRYVEEEQAKDAVMQIFEELIDKLKKHEVRHFKSWLHVLARHYCLMQLRQRRRREGHLQPLEEERLVENAAAFHHDPEDGLGREEDLQRMERCLETLPEEQRRSVELFYLQERSYREIESQTGYDLKKVKSYIQNGKRNLKNCMEKRAHA